MGNQGRPVSTGAGGEYGKSSKSPGLWESGLSGSKTPVVGTC